MVSSVYGWSATAVSVARSALILLMHAVREGPKPSSDITVPVSTSAPESISGDDVSGALVSGSPGAVVSETPASETLVSRREPLSRARNGTWPAAASLSPPPPPKPPVLTEPPHDAGATSSARRIPTFVPRLRHERFRCLPFRRTDASCVVVECAEPSMAKGLPSALSWRAEHRHEAGTPFSASIDACPLLFDPRSPASPVRPDEVSDGGCMLA